MDEKTEKQVVYETSPCCYQEAVKFLHEQGFDAVAREDPHADGVYVGYAGHRRGRPNRVYVAVPKDQAKDAEETLQKWETQKHESVKKLSGPIDFALLHASIIAVVVTITLTAFDVIKDLMLPVLAITWFVLFAILYHYKKNEKKNDYR